MTSDRRPLTLDDFISTFGLRKKGQEWVGPCPICGEGDDRFHVKEGRDKPIFGCRQCMDDGQDTTGERAKQVLTLASGRIAPERRKTSGQGQSTTRTQNAPQTPPTARELPNADTDTQYTYRYADGKTAFVVVRHVPKRFSQWTPQGNKWIPKAHEAPRPMYRLPEMLASQGRVAVVEGEKCAHASLAAWPMQAVVTWAGGTNAWRQTDWQPLAGREVSLLADGDEPGHKAMNQLAAHLTELGCKVRIALPDTNDDVADWIERDGVEAAGRRVASLLQDYTPPEKPQSIADSEPQDLIEQDIPDFEHNDWFVLRGFENDRLVFWHKKRQRLVYKSPISLMKEDDLTELAAESFWVSAWGKGELSKKTARRIGDYLVRKGEDMPQFDSSKVYRRGAAKLPDGEVAYHLGDRVLVGDTERELDGASDGIWLAEPRIELDESATDRQLQDIAQAVLAYRWADEVHGKRIMGWLVAAIVGGALDWRPHMMLNAPASSGKSWLLTNVVNPILGPLLMPLVDATPAAIARLMEGSSLPIAIDEAEPTSPWVMEVLKLLRYASSDSGFRVRADQGGGVTKQSIRVTALLSGVVAPRLEQADASRLTMVRLGDDVENWPAVRRGILDAMKHADAARYRIIREAPRIVRDIATFAEQQQESGVDSRVAMTEAALTIGWRFWGVDKTYVYSADETAEGTDASDALLELLALPFRTSGGAERSVLHMLTDSTYAGELADLYGVKLNGRGILIATPHTGLSNRLARTKWANADFRRMLLQLPGVKMSPNPLKFGSVKKRAIMVPHETLNAAGVELPMEGENE